MHFVMKYAISYTQLCIFLSIKKVSNTYAILIKKPMRKCEFHPDTLNTLKVTLSISGNIAVIKD